MSRVVLLTTLYKPRSDQRAREYDKCLSINSRNTEIDKIVVFFEKKDESGYEDFPSLDNEKIELITIEHRPSYKFFFDYANKYLKGDYVIVSNADIFYEEESSIGRVREIGLNHLWALCRYNYNKKNKKWELQGGGLQGSADSWVFKSPIVDFEDDIIIGMAGCDTYLCQKAVEGGMVVYNPALSILSKHEHKTLERNRSLTYKENPDYMQCGYGAYCPSASTIEVSICASSQTLRYKLSVLPVSLRAIGLCRKIKSMVRS